MEATAAAALIMGGGSAAAYLKLVVSYSCKHNDDIISPLLHHHHHPRNTKHHVPLIKLLSSSSSSSSSVVSTNCSSTTRRTTSVFRLRPVSACSSSSSSSHTHHHQLQAEYLDNHKSLIQESLNGHTIRVTFQLSKQCSFGDNFLLTGDDQVLGLWDPNNAVPLTWSEGHLWSSAHLDIPIGKCIKFKFIMQQSDGVIVWQPGPDRVLECFKTDKTMTLCEDWEDPDLRKIIEIKPALNQEIQMVEASGETLIQVLVSGNDTDEEPKVYATNMKQVPASDEGVVPVLVPGLNQYQEDSVNVTSNDKHVRSLNGSVMVSTEPDDDDMAKDLILPDESLDLKGEANTSTLINSRPEMSSVREIQDSSDHLNEHHQQQQQQQQQATEEEQVTQHSLHHNDVVKWGHNVAQKLLSIIFGIQSKR